MCLLKNWILGAGSTISPLEYINEFL
jgi:hypothetical protein